MHAARRALEGAELAPGTLATLHALTDPEKRPPLPRSPIPEDLIDPQPRVLLNLCEDTFATNLRCARCGAVGGPSSMMGEHLRILLDCERASHALYEAAVGLARADVPREILDTLRLGRLTALKKPNGGVRGIVAGDILRRLVARTMAQQYAVRCPPEREQNLSLTLCRPVDGIGAYDLISRETMLSALRNLDGGG